MQDDDRKADGEKDGPAARTGYSGYRERAPSCLLFRCRGSAVGWREDGDDFLVQGRVPFAG
jgi:hypothetical protein